MPGRLRRPSIADLCEVTVTAIKRVDRILFRRCVIRFLFRARLQADSWDPLITDRPPVRCRSSGFLEPMLNKVAVAHRNCNSNSLRRLLLPEADRGCYTKGHNARIGVPIVPSAPVQV